MLFRSVLQDKIFKNFDDSPISIKSLVKDVCIYAPGHLNKNGKESKTSWDSFSYMLLMAHNVYQHITAVQEANRRFNAGERPAMMRSSAPGGEKFEDIVEAIFAAPDKDTAMAVIDMYGGPLGYFTEIIGTRGFKGKKAVNGSAFFSKNFTFEDDEPADTEIEPEEEFDETKLEHLGEE